jgi:hypothetical protein
MYLQKGTSKKTKQNIFCWRLEGRRQKEQDLEPDPLVRGTDLPTHTKMSRIPNSKNIVQEYFGGASLLNTSTFQLVNGFSNQYWGWGGEDDDLLQRLRCD